MFKQKNKKIKKNKKAGFFAILLVIFTLILTTTALHTFALSKNKVAASLEVPSQVVSFSNDIDKKIFYEKDNLKVASIQAFNDMLVQGAVKSKEECKFTGDYIVFNNACEPNENEIAEFFVEKLQENEKVRDYIFTLAEKNTKLSAEKEKTEEKRSFSGSFSKYDLSYEINNEYIINLAEEGIDFSDIMDMYIKSLACKDSENIKACVKVANGWIFEFQEEGYKFFSFRSIRYYYHDSEFSPLEFNFALE